MRVGNKILLRVKERFVNSSPVTLYDMTVTVISVGTREDPMGLYGILLIDYRHNYIRQ